MSFERLLDRIVDLGGNVVSQWLVVGVVALLIYGVFRRFFRPRRIQETPFNWRILRHELIFSALTLSVSGLIFGVLRRALGGGRRVFAEDPAAWWEIGFEFAVYFFAFDLYFYLLHRLMHMGPLYTLIHKTHHRSTAPNPLTAFSFNPIEGALTGGFLSVFLTTFQVHRPALYLIVGFQPFMSMFVHAGHEIFPRWWYKTWLTKWFLTSMFHDQHHQLYHCNYGGFTTLWDRVFGTVNPTFEADFDRLKARVARDPIPAAIAVGGG